MEASASNDPHIEMIHVLKRAEDLLARPTNDFSWSSWNNSEEALAEIGGYISGLARGLLPNRNSLEVLFAPTGPIQETSISSGWGDEFLELAGDFDSVAERLWGNGSHKTNSDK